MSNYYPRAGERHSVNGVEVTGFQLAFAMYMRRHGTHYWVDQYGRANLTQESRSHDRRLVDALVLKGLAEVHTEDYEATAARTTSYGHREATHCDREVYKLLPPLVEFIDAWQKAENAREAASRRASNDRHAAEQAARDARLRDQKASDMATAALVKAHEAEFADLLQAAYVSLDTTAAAVAAGESIKSFQESK